MNDILTTVFDRWLIILFRAVVILGTMFLLFWVWRPQWTARFRIPQPIERPIRPWREIPLTILGLSVYLIPLSLIGVVQKQFGYSAMYLNIEDRGLAYFVLSIFLFAALIDTSFYWVHRWMHGRTLMRKNHLVHHASYNINPLTSYSTDWAEALTTMLPFMVAIFVIPWHPLALLIFSLYGIFNAGYLHLGYDFAYERRRKNPILKWHNTSTHHAAHHHHFDGNYGLYFTFWDKVMGTEI